MLEFIKRDRKWLTIFFGDLRERKVTFYNPNDVKNVIKKFEIFMGFMNVKVDERINKKICKKVKK